MYQDAAIPSDARPPEWMAAGLVLGGKYRLLHKLGEGATGAVWAARNETIARDVALKVLIQPEPDLRQRLLREGRACGTLKHPNIVDVYDVAQTDRGEPFLVMELLSGETLAELLKTKRRLDLALCARIGADVAKALAAAHAMHIIHRDLKPANIFLHRANDTAPMVVKVVDFGLAKNLILTDGLKTSTGSLLGSPLFMSPEQIRSDKNIDHRTDLWSLGVVLFMMATGTKPFKGSGENVLAHILSGEIPRISQLIRHADPRLDDIVDRCLQRDREDRFSSATEIARLLEAIVEPAVGPSIEPSMQSAPQAAVTPSAPAIAKQSAVQEKPAPKMGPAEQGPAPDQRVTANGTVVMPKGPSHKKAATPPASMKGAYSASETPLVHTSRAKKATHVRASRLSIAITVAAVSFGFVTGTAVLMRELQRQERKQEEEKRKEGEDGRTNEQAAKPEGEQAKSPATTGPATPEPAMATLQPSAAPTGVPSGAAVATQAITAVQSQPPAQVALPAKPAATPQPTPQPRATSPKPTATVVSSQPAPTSTTATPAGAPKPSSKPTYEPPPRPF